jgi:hypothetical protein
MKSYKITNLEGKTRGFLQWGENITHKAKGNNRNLCSDGWIHFYNNIELADFFNPIHGKYLPDYLLWEGKAEGEIKGDRGIKWGCKKFTTIKRIEPIKLDLITKIAFGILCSLEVYKEPSYIEWTNKWLNKEDRAYAAANAAYVAYAANAAAYAADAAAYAAAYAAANAAYAAYAANAAYAADAAAYAADAAADINLLEILQKYKML